MSRRDSLRLDGMIWNCGRVNGCVTMGRAQVRPAMLMASEPWASKATVVRFVSAAAPAAGYPGSGRGGGAGTAACVRAASRATSAAAAARMSNSARLTVIRCGSCG